MVIIKYNILNIVKLICFSRVVGYFSQPEENQLKLMLESFEYRRFCIFFIVVAHHESDYNSLTEKVEVIRQKMNCFNF